MTYRTTWSQTHPGADPRRPATPLIWIALAVAVLAILAAAGVAIAIAVMSEDSTPPGFARAEAQLFPGFVPERAAEVSVENGGRRIVLARRQGGWVIASQDGYPTRPGAVEDLLRQLAAAETVYAATGNIRQPEVYGLGADRGVSVLVRDDQQRPLLQARFGRTISEPGGEAATMTAVQRGADGRIVLARGEIAPQAALARWTSTFVMHYLAPQIVEARPAAPEGARPAKVQQDELGRIRTDTGIRTETGEPPQAGDPALGRAAEVTRALENVRFEDVRAAGAVPGDAQPIGTAHYRTRDGVEIAVQLTRVDGEAVWARFAIDVRRARGESAQVAQRLRDQVDGWAFRLPRETAARMIVAREQIAPK